MYRITSSAIRSNKSEPAYNQIKSIVELKIGKKAFDKINKDLNNGFRVFYESFQTLKTNIELLVNRFETHVHNRSKRNLFQAN